MSPFKTFSAGETLTASDVNTYLAKQAVVVCTSGTRPGSPVEGQVIWETDTDKLLTYDGTNWTLPKNVAGGMLSGGYAQIVVSQSAIGALTDVTGLAVTVTVAAGRRIKVTGHGPMGKTGGAGIAYGLIREGATTLATYGYANIPNAEVHVMHGSVILTPSAGAHTYKLSAAALTNTMTVEASAVDPHWILVEDIGAA